jgi:hypothetical protein
MRIPGMALPIFVIDNGTVTKCGAHAVVVFNESWAEKKEYMDVDGSL